jgi:hypothetical protein
MRLIVDTLYNNFYFFGNGIIYLIINSKEYSLQSEFFLHDMSPNKQELAGWFVVFSFQLLKFGSNTTITASMNRLELVSNSLFLSCVSSERRNHCNKFSSSLSLNNWDPQKYIHLFLWIILQRVTGFFKFILMSHFIFRMLAEEYFQQNILRIHRNFEMKYNSYNHSCMPLCPIWNNTHKEKRFPTLFCYHEFNKIIFITEYYNITDIYL